MEIKDYFKILGVDRKADLKEIKKAYRKLALKYHPDMNAEAGAEDKFKEVAEAYEVLKSPEKRAEYEALLQHGTTQSGDFPPGWQSGARHTRDFQSEAEFSDFFNQFFGGGRQRPHPGSAEPDLFKGQDIEIEVPIFLEDTLTTNQKDLQYNVPVIEGQYIHQQKKKLKVRIPEGVKDGERIRVKGQGAPGSEHRLNGDLFLHIRLVPHPLCDVQGHDLILKVPVTPWEAALGCKINIPTLKGKVNLAIPPNSQNGAKLRLKGQGLKSRDGAGDLFAIVNIAMPADNPKSSQQFWQGLAENIPFEPRAEWSV